FIQRLLHYPMECGVSSVRNMIYTSKNLQHILEERRKDPRIKEAEELEAQAQALRDEVQRDDTTPELIMDSLRGIISWVLDSRSDHRPLPWQLIDATNELESALDSMESFYGRKGIDYDPFD